MAECAVCGNSSSLSYTCDHCGGSFCEAHQLPENHDCVALSAEEHSRWFSEKFEGDYNYIADVEGEKRGFSIDRKGKEVDLEHHGPESDKGDRDDSGSSVSDRDDSQSDTGLEGTESEGTEEYSRREEADLTLSGSNNESEANTSRTPPTKSSPDVGIDGSIRGPETDPIKSTSTGNNGSNRTRRNWWIVLFVLMIPVAAGLGVYAMGLGDQPNADSGAAAVPSTGTSTPSPESATETDSEAAASSGGGLNETAISMAIHNRVNEIRAQRGIEPLTYYERTAKNAQEHTNWMANTSTFEHSEENQYLCRPLGENIAYTYAYSDIDTGYNGIVNYYGNETAIGEGIVSQWMNSEGHRENLLDDEFQRQGIGISTANVEDGKTRVYATQALCG